MKTFSEKSSSKDTLTRNRQGTNHKQVPVKISVPAFRSIPLIQRKSLCPCDGGCPSCTNVGTIQPKLTIGQPNDKYEQEADRVADQIMRMPEPGGSLVNGHLSLVQRKTGCVGPTCTEEEELIQTKPIGYQITPLDYVQRLEETVPEKEEEEPVQLKSSTDKSPPVTAGLQSQIRSMKENGQPLPESTRKFFEPRFGKDFSQVRVHTNEKAADAAKSINSKAFTTGKDIVFGAGQYSPGTTAGKQLIAHELTHVVQQEIELMTAVRRQLEQKETVGPCPDIPTPHILLRRGSIHPAVREAQRKLNTFHEQRLALGLDGLPGGELVEDCIFGTKTFESVVVFQQHMFPFSSEEWDGIIGPKTWAGLDSVPAGNTVIIPMCPIHPQMNDVNNPGASFSNMNGPIPSIPGYTLCGGGGGGGGGTKKSKTPTCCVISIPSRVCKNKTPNSEQDKIFKAFKEAANWLPGAKQKMENYISDEKAKKKLLPANKKAVDALWNHFMWTQNVRKQIIYPDIPKIVLEVINDLIDKLSTVPICPHCPRTAPKGTEHAASPNAWANTNCYEFFPAFFKDSLILRAQIAVHEMVHSWRGVGAVETYEHEGPPKYPPPPAVAKNNPDSFAALIRDLK